MGFNTWSRVIQTYQSNTDIRVDSGLYLPTNTPNKRALIVEAIKQTCTLYVKTHLSLFSLSVQHFSFYTLIRVETGLSHIQILSFSEYIFPHSYAPGEIHSGSLIQEMP